MIYLIPIGSILYGLLLYYNLFTPRVYHGSAMGNIIFGIIFLVAIPFLKSLEKEEKNKPFSENYFCFSIYGIGSVLVLLHLYEIYKSDIMFVLTVLIMSFCQSCVNWYQNKKGRR